MVAAHAGDVAGQVSVDGLHARTRSTEAGSGPEEVLDATELGFRVRLDLRELDDRLELEIDYRDREPVAGSVRNSPMRLLYAGELRYAVVEDTLEVGVGRFLAPAALLTPVDGARAELTLGEWSLEAYGGRRGFSQSRRNLGFDTLLPAVGGAVRRSGERLQFVALGGYSEDELLLLPDDPLARNFGAAHAQSSLVLRPVDALRVGGEAAFTQQASYLLGPAWSDLTVQAEAFDLWRGMLWADWNPIDAFGLLADFHHQEVGVYSVGSVDDNAVTVALQEPRFTDVRLEADIGLWKRGYVRPLGRYRIRADRQEVRTGAQVDIDDFGLPGPFASARLFFDEIQGDVPDRLIWSASAGYDRGPIEVQGGASFIERETGPFGSRRLDGASGEDLNPFVLEAQKVAFVRAFWSADRWFAGLDVEQSLVAPELRVFLQLGALQEVRW